MGGYFDIPILPYEDPNKDTSVDPPKPSYGGSGGLFDLPIAFNELRKKAGLSPLEPETPPTSGGYFDMPESTIPAIKKAKEDKEIKDAKDLAVPYGEEADKIAAQAKIDALTKGSMSDYGYDEALAQHTGGWSGAKPREQSWASGGWEFYGMSQEEKDKMLDAIQRGGR